jgi:hypothetical protein
VSVAPFLETFVQIDEPLTQLAHFRIVAVRFDEDLLNLGRRLQRAGDISPQGGLGDRITPAFEKP